MVNESQQSTAMFQGQDVHETCELCFRQHWIRLLRPVAKTAVWTLLIFTMGYMIFGNTTVADPFTRRLILVVLSLLFSFAQWELLSRFYRYFLNITVITNNKVHRIKKTLFAIDDHQSIDIWMLQDINKSQHGPIQNILGFGSLILDAQETTMRIHFTPHISKKYHTLMQLRERARGRVNNTGNGQHKENQHNAGAKQKNTYNNPDEVSH